MNPFSINSLTDEDIDLIEDNIKGIGEGGSGGKSHRGPKTSKEISYSHKKNAKKKRIETSKDKIIKDLEHFPIKSISAEKSKEYLVQYSDWILKSIDQSYPFISDIDKEIKFKQTRSSGPGGQNVNKTSTAVIAKHILTGISARSESREMLNNRSDSISKVLLNLENHVRNWKIFLSDVSSYLKKEKIILFMQKYLNEEVK